MPKKREKLAYKIGEACRELDIQPYVLRYWETEFPFLKPDKSKSGQRVYSQEELDVIRRIKELLYDEGYTIAGAKKKLESELDEGGPKLRGSSDEDASDEDASDGADAEDVATAGARLSEVRAQAETLLGEARELLERLAAS